MLTCTGEPRIQIHKLVGVARVAAIHVFGVFAVFVGTIVNGRDAPGHSRGRSDATTHPPVAFMPRAMAGWPS